MTERGLLSKYWSATIYLRHFDFHLASICNHKSEYCINPDNYDENRVKELEIKLGDVREAYRKMLSPNNKFSVSIRKK